MIYLIGGSPRSGKTILSKKLSKKLGIQNISTDILRLFMVASLNEDDKYKYFPFEKMFDLAITVDTFYKQTSGADMLSADIEEAKNLMPGILAFIEYFKNAETDYIIEGVHFLPSLINHLKEDEGIKIIILTKNNSDKIYDGLKENEGKGDWIADNINDDQILLKAAKSLAQYGKYFEAESTKYGFHCINTEDNFLDKIEDALSYLE